MTDHVTLPSTRVQDDSSRHIRNFNECLQRCKAHGKRFLVNPDTRELQFENADFYLYRHLEEYFQDTARVKELFDVLLSVEDQNKLQPEKIAEKYIKVFAILIFIGEGNWIQHFVEHQINDGMLPFRYADVPSDWPAVSNRRIEFWDRFCEAQWMFCPHQFEVTDLHTKVNSSAILPLRTCEILDNNSWDTVVYKIEIYPDYHGFYSRGESEKPKNPALHNIFVVKSLNGTDRDHCKRYEQEVSAFRTLGVIPMPGAAEPSNDIVRCYGSFVQNGTYNILLEYADQGTLVNYFEEIPYPLDVQQMVDLWDSLARIASGVWRIHCVLDRKSGDRRSVSFHQGYHQDLKPANILVFRNGEESPYRYTFKIADLGLSYFLQGMGPASEFQGPAKAGSITYGSPEKSMLQHDYHSRDFRGQASDNWSLACIFSVAATWMVSGKEGVQEFAQRRREARKDLSKTSIDCFHDDEKVLDAVEEWHAILFDRARKTDKITERVFNEVLLPAFDKDVSSRNNAWQLHNAIEKLSKPPVKRDSTRIADFENGTIRTPPRGPSQAGHPERQLSHSTPNVSPSHASHRDWHDRVHGFGHSTSPSVLGGGLHDEPEVHHDLTDYRHSITRAPRSDLTRRNRAEREHELQGYRNQRDSLPTTRPEADVENDESIKVSESQHVPQQHDKSCPKYDEETRLPLPIMTIAELFDWKARRGTNKNASVPNSTWKEMLKDRDHVLIVDDSRSMKPYWKEMCKLFGALAKFIKDCDPDGAELYTTVSAKRPLRSKDTTKLHDRVVGLGTSLEADSQPEVVLRRVLDNYRDRIRNGKNPGLLSKKEPRPIPLCIYMFTDGVWQGNTDLTSIISDYVDLLEEPPQAPVYHIGIQFIRFGDDATGKERLDTYDKLGRSPPTSVYIQQGGTSTLVRDIVDTVPSDGNVWKMLLGSVNKKFDDDCNCGLSQNNP